MSRRNRKKQVTLVERPSSVIDIEEARRTTKTAGSARSFSLAWDETEALGITADMRRSGPGMLSDQERKETLYKAYLNNVWISACIDVIAKRITSGGFVISEVKQGEGSETNRALLDALLHYVNEDEDFLQLIRSIATDLLIYGEAYMEVVTKAGKPWQLHKVDCQTMNYTLDRHGNVLKYTQNMTHSTDVVEFAPEEIIRWWLPDPKASKKALSPIERILGPVDADTRMADWVRQFFRKGARPPFWIKYPGPRAEAERFVAYLRENYTGQANAHVPLVMYDEAELHEVGKGAIDVDFLQGRDQMCKEILAAFLVPPALVGLIESGNIGGGTGESQEKSIQYNACDPVKQLIFEKFNFRVVQRGFGITDWAVSTRYADYRSDDIISKLQDTRIRNGSNTVNEVRTEIGKAPVDGGDEAVLVASRDVVPVQRLGDMAEEQRQQTSMQLEQQSASVDMAKTRAEQLKNPPEQQPSNEPPPRSGKLPQPRKPKERAQGRSAHTGIMVAFMLRSYEAQQLALPDGEPPEDLHVTLAFMGDIYDEAMGRYHPARNLKKLREVLAEFAAGYVPLQGKVGGLGRFTPSDSSGGVSPVIALVNAQGLQGFRRMLVDALEFAGFGVANDFDYTPHITLAYIQNSAPMPVDSLPDVALRFDNLCLAVGDDRYFFPIGEPNIETRESLSDLHWQDDAAFVQDGLSRLRDDGVQDLTWEADESACDMCMLNDGKTVKLGERFPSGAVFVPQHGSCGCQCRDERGRKWYWTGIGEEYTMEERRPEHA